MIWATVAPFVLLFTQGLTLTKGAFVGGWTADGKAISLKAPTVGRWVSSEQIQRELLFRQWKPPLTTVQMAELAKSLEADFAVDLLAAAVKEGKRWQALVAVRTVSASLSAIVHLSQERLPISSPDQLPNAVQQKVPKIFVSLPSQLPTATVQIRESDRKLHLSARSGKWCKGTEVLFYREAGDQRQIVGMGRLVRVRRAIDGKTWLLEAEITQNNDTVRAGDKAIALFRLPVPLAKWQ